MNKELDCALALVGMMGTGKSSVGAELARSLDLPFYDSDALIVEKLGMSVPKIFNHLGEEKFREEEEGIIAPLLDKGGCIIATGGGAVTTPSVLEIIKTKALSVWLKVDAETIFERVKDHEDRPLLKTHDPLQTIKDIADAREALYSQADICVEGGHESVEQMTERVIQALSDHMKRASF